MPQNLVHQNIQFNTAGLENRAGGDVFTHYMIAIPGGK